MLPRRLEYVIWFLGVFGMATIAWNIAKHAEENPQDNQCLAGWVRCN